ncbi:sulfotransferase domain-containing protein [Neptuniibacter sp.]|uniref:sulfotransferase domain-containing protein n=1 Tax=Neptuniibacter sp. TaxID=1962643 RepID=UPI002627D8AB|nr:sulfotransferase domain-containing protein [Neptuniibacter sp.]MCP4596124.1 sulfotransferase domain-containing protein [Neptuniibacter sp.]
MGIPEQNMIGLDNIYYCCVQKTASQWLRAVFDDPLFNQYTGLAMHPYRVLGLNTANITEPFPEKTVVTHLYINNDTYKNIKKSGAYKTFFITRDPRDSVVSWYYSAKYSHKLMDPIPEMRAQLVQLNRDDGLRYIIDKIDSFGYFDAQLSWAKSGEKVFNYELISRDPEEFLKQLFIFLDIHMVPEDFQQLCHKHSFQKKADGREQGEEDINSHFRKGVVGDWKTHLDQGLLDYLDSKSPNLIEELGYQ